MSKPGRALMLGITDKPSEMTFLLHEAGFRRGDIVVDTRSARVHRFGTYRLGEGIDSLFIAEGYASEWNSTLGSKPANDAFYTSDNRLDYDVWLTDQPIRTELNRYVSELREGRNVAFIDSSPNPATAHRTRGIGRFLLEHSIDAIHPAQGPYTTLRQSTLWQTLDPQARRYAASDVPRKERVKAAPKQRV